MKPQPSMEKSGERRSDERARSIAPSAKVAKLRVRASPPPIRADEVVDRDVEEDVAQADQRRAGHAARASPRRRAATRSPRASITERARDHGALVTPMRSEIFPA